MRPTVELIDNDDGTWTTSIYYSTFTGSSAQCVAWLRAKGGQAVSWKDDAKLFAEVVPWLVLLLVALSCCMTTNSRSGALLFFFGLAVIASMSKSR